MKTRNIILVLAAVLAIVLAAEFVFAQSNAPFGGGGGLSNLGSQLQGLPSRTFDMFNNFVTNGYHSYPKAFDFTVFFLLFFAITLIGIRKWMGDKENDRTSIGLALVLGLTFAFAIVFATEFTLLHLAPFAKGFIFLILVLVVYAMLLKVGMENHKVAAFLLACLITFIMFWAFGAFTDEGWGSMSIGEQISSIFRGSGGSGDGDDDEGTGGSLDELYEDGDDGTGSDGDPIGHLEGTTCSELLEPSLFNHLYNIIDEVENLIDGKREIEDEATHLTQVLAQCKTEHEQDPTNPSKERNYHTALQNYHVFFGNGYFSVADYREARDEFAVWGTIRNDPTEPLRLYYAMLLDRYYYDFEYIKANVGGNEFSLKKRRIEILASFRDDEIREAQDSKTNSALRIYENILLNLPGYKPPIQPYLPDGGFRTT